MPLGITEDYLIEPSYARAREWNIYGLDDRLTPSQLDILLRSKSNAAREVYGIYTANSRRVSVPLASSTDAIRQFFVEMSGGDVCIFDLPNTFLVCVLEGDISLVAANPTTLREMFGSSAMERADWIDLSRNLRLDIAARIRSYYLPH